MDRLTDEVRQESPWNMMFTDDIVICSESKKQVERSLERWRYAIERRGMKVNRSKTEYMCVNERDERGVMARRFFCKELRFQRLRVLVSGINSIPEIVVVR